MFAFGDAGFYGSLGAAPPVDHVIGMAVARDERGYWLLRRDGTIAVFGSAMSQTTL